MKRNYCLSLMLLALFGMSSPNSVKAADGENTPSSQSTQQAKKITGKVVDATGEPIIGASVLVKGTGTGAVTDIDGNFSVDVQQGSTLIISFVGYTSAEIKVGTGSVYNVTLADDTQALSEVVVTAMGIKKERKALGYAVQDVNSKELLKNKNANVINSLNGKIAGVNITQSGGSAGAGAQIVLRGGTSLERDNQPLFVVDGVIYDNSTAIGGDSGFDGMLRTASSFGNRVMDINPEDVENMSVLKGPAAAALYGSRAAAGVIVITTKKGNTDGTTEVTFNTRFTTSWVNRLPDMQDTYKRGQYNDLGNLETDWVMSSWGEKYKSGEKAYDNLENFFNNGASYDNTLTVSGGNKAGSYFLSISRFDQNGIVPNTGYDKTTFRFNGDRKYGNFTVAANVAFSVSNTDKTLTSSGLWDSDGKGGNGAMQAVYSWARSEDMARWINDDGSKYRIFQDLDPDNQNLVSDTDNPYWIINKNKMWDKTTRFTGSVAPSYKIADWLNVSYRAGIDRYTTNDYTYIAPGAAMKDIYQNGRLSTNDFTYEYLTSNLIITANQKVGDFDLGLMLGHSAEDTKVRRERRTGYDFITPDFPSFENIDQSTKQFQSYQSRKRLMGVFGEFRASYKNIAYLTVTGRNDWTSTLPVNNRSYFYPSVSGSFVFTELLPENEVLSFGKIRASWARVGKDTDAYATTTALWAPRTFLAGVGTGNSWTRGNPYLRPEITESTELGLEMRFFKGRLGFDFTYYTNDSKDQIVSPRLSQTNGYIMYSTNVGNVYNKGMELSITAIPVETKDWRWETTLNFAGNRGTVENLLQGMELLYVTDVQIGGVKAASVNNGNFMALTGNKWKRTDDGKVILDATTGLPTYTSNGTEFVGNREPNMSGGWNNTIQYKNWNLSMLWDFRFGGAIYNGTEYDLTVNGLSTRTQNRDKLEITGVVPDGTDASGNTIYKDATFTFEAGKNYDILNPDGTVKTARNGNQIIQDYYSNIYTKESSNFITKTNWMRLRSISLSYTFDKSLLAKTKFIKGCSINVTGNNLLLFTNYKGLDPENSVAGSGVTGSSSTGIDYCGVPSTASMSFGINLTF